MPDTQITELAGRHYLISQLLAGGVEVALPIRDRGIDLIAYLDRTDTGHGFLACPIQLKANQQARFSLDRKYAQFHNLLMVYAWNVSGPTPELYALTYAEAEALLHKHGHAQTHSWQTRGGYTLTVNDAWRSRLQSYRMQPDRWIAKIAATAASPPGSLMISASEVHP